MQLISAHCWPQNINFEIFENFNSHRILEIFRKLGYYEIDRFFSKIYLKFCNFLETGLVIAVNDITRTSSSHFSISSHLMCSRGARNSPRNVWYSITIFSDILNSFVIKKVFGHFLIFIKIKDWI